MKKGKSGKSAREMRREISDLLWYIGRELLKTADARLPALHKALLRAAAACLDENKPGEKDDSAGH